MAKEEEVNGVASQKAPEEIKKVEHNNIHEALSAFQGDVKVIKRNGEFDFETKSGKQLNFKYATLEDIVETINPVLAKHGLSVRYEIDEKGIECILNHSTTEQKEIKRETHYTVRDEISGFKDRDLFGFVAINEIRSGKLPLDLTMSDMKDVGGQITYGRRYTIGLVLGLATEEDKDTQLMDKARKNTSTFAFNKAKEQLKTAEGEELEKQIKYLEKELKLAEGIENGTGKHAPAIGLSSNQYRELIMVAKAKVINNPEDNGADAQ